MNEFQTYIPICLKYEKDGVSTCPDDSVSCVEVMALNPMQQVDDSHDMEVGGLCTSFGMKRHGC
jgi:hypothetical protein